MKTKRAPSILAAALMCALAVTTTRGADAPKMKMTTPIPPSITTPDSVETRLGRLKFFDGIPDEATVVLFRRSLRLTEVYFDRT